MLLRNKTCDTVNIVNLLNIHGQLIAAIFFSLWNLFTQEFFASSLKKYEKYNKNFKNSNLPNEKATNKQNTLFQLFQYI